MNMDETEKNSNGMRASNVMHETKKGEIADDADFGTDRDTLMNGSFLT